jgi:hypothetical protein
MQTAQAENRVSLQEKSTATCGDNKQQLGLTCVSPHMFIGARTSNSIGCSRKSALLRCTIFDISASGRDTSVPGLWLLTDSSLVMQSSSSRSRTAGSLSASSAFAEWCDSDMAGLCDALGRRTRAFACCNYVRLAIDRWLTDVHYQMLLLCAERLRPAHAAAARPTAQIFVLALDRFAARIATLCVAAACGECVHHHAAASVSCSVQ